MVQVVWIAAAQEFGEATAAAMPVSRYLSQAGFWEDVLIFCSVNTVLFVFYEVFAGLRYLGETPKTKEFIWGFAGGGIGLLLISLIFWIVAASWFEETRAAGGPVKLGQFPAIVLAIAFFGVLHIVAAIVGRILGCLLFSVVGPKEE